MWDVFHVLFKVLPILWHGRYVEKLPLEEPRDYSACAVFLVPAVKVSLMTINSKNLYWWTIRKLNRILRSFYGNEKIPSWRWGLKAWNLARVCVVHYRNIVIHRCLERGTCKSTVRLILTEDMFYINSTAQRRVYWKLNLPRQDYWKFNLYFHHIRKRCNDRKLM